MTKVEDEGGVCGTKHSGGVELPVQSRNPFTEDADDPIDPVDDGEEEDELPAESRISKIFSENTTKTVIILILVNLFMQPLFMMETFPLCLRYRNVEPMNRTSLVTPTRSELGFQKCMLVLKICRTFGSP